MLYSILGLSLLYYATHATTYCYDEEECSATDIDDDYALCYGYEACEESDVSVSSAAYCSGDEGCWLASVESDDAYVYCSGDYGCWRGHVVNDESYTFCTGNYGCYIADIWSWYTACWGNAGCQYSTISTYADTDVYSYAYVSAYGYLSNAYGDIIASEDLTTYIFIYGYLSGYYTFIDCEAGGTCYIYCSGDGCYETRVFCYDGATCSVSCDEDYCPDEYDIDSDAALSYMPAGGVLNGEKVDSNYGLKQLRAKLDEERQAQAKTDEAKMSAPSFPSTKAKQTWTHRNAMSKKNIEFVIGGTPADKRSKKVSSESFLGGISWLRSNSKNNAFMYGAGVATVIYLIFTLCFYYGYYKPRKGDMYQPLQN